MAWRTLILNDGLRDLLEADRDHPYLASLLRSAPEHADLATERLENYLAARAEDRTRPSDVEALPFHVVLDPSNVCNLSCPLCVQATDPDGRRRRTLDMDDYRELLGRLSRHVIRLDLFGWGEPMLHPRFADLVRLAADRSIFTRTSSHFSLPGDFRPEELIEAGLDYVVASIDGTTQEVYGEYRRGGDLETALRNVESLVHARERLGAARPVVEWQYLVMRHNLQELEEARRRAGEVGVDVMRYGGARGRMVSKILVDTPTNFEQSREVLLDPEHPLSEYRPDGRKTRQEETERCRWLWGRVALHPDGGVSPCWTGWFDEHDYGDWTSRPLEEIWRGETFRRARASACSGGSENGDLVCDSCARYRNFVPTPDRHDEPLPDPGLVRRLARRMRRAGSAPSPDVVRALSAAADSTDEEHGPRGPNADRKGCTA